MADLSEKRKHRKKHFKRPIVTEGDLNAAELGRGLREMVKRSLRNGKNPK